MDGSITEEATADVVEVDGGSEGCKEDEVVGVSTEG